MRDKSVEMKPKVWTLRENQAAGYDSASDMDISSTRAGKLTIAPHETLYLIWFQ